MTVDYCITVDYCFGEEVGVRDVTLLILIGPSRITE
jgi:hypothetical protein